ncbi:MAG TPA: hypothetical protein DDW52_11855, partial [Planctomycetaceae bacterium]|nr:hypothetical protein [Planctomycetaceae bacterium]
MSEEKSAEQQGVQIAFIGLRLFGLMFLVDGLAGMFGQAAYESFFDPKIDYASGMSRANIWSGRITYGVYTLTGLYCLLDGRWVVKQLLV